MSFFFNFAFFKFFEFQMAILEIVQLMKGDKYLFIFKVKKQFGGLLFIEILILLVCLKHSNLLFDKHPNCIFIKSFNIIFFQRCIFFKTNYLFICIYIYIYIKDVW